MAESHETGRCPDCDAWDMDVEVKLFDVEHREGRATLYGQLRKSVWFVWQNEGFQCRLCGRIWAVADQRLDNADAYAHKKAAREEAVRCDS